MSESEALDFIRAKRWYQQRNRMWLRLPKSGESTDADWCLWRLLRNVDPNSPEESALVSLLVEVTK